jgi:hypothetical protein
VQGLSRGEFSVTFGSANAGKPPDGAFPKTYTAGVDTIQWRRTAIGRGALANATGPQQVGVGLSAGVNSSADDGVFVGNFAGLECNAPGTVAVGRNSGFRSGGFWATYAGQQSGRRNGYGNSYDGTPATDPFEDLVPGVSGDEYRHPYELDEDGLPIVTGSGPFGTAFAPNPFTPDPPGLQLTAFGDASGDGNTGSRCAGYGAASLERNEGHRCVAVGVNTLRSNTGDFVSALGQNAGNGNTGDSCIFIGRNTASGNQTGDNCIFIGNGRGTGNTANNRLEIGSATTATPPLITGDLEAGRTGFGANFDTTFRHRFFSSGIEALMVDTPNTGTAIGPIAELFRDKASPANNDEIGALRFSGRTSTGVKREYARINARILTTTNGAENSEIRLRPIRGGAILDMLRVSNGVQIGSPSGGYQGDGTLNTQGAIFSGGVQVLASRRTGWAAATGTATRTTFATGSVTLEQLAERVKGLIDDCIAHGLIGA